MNDGRWEVGDLWGETGERHHLSVIEKNSVSGLRDLAGSTRLNWILSGGLDGVSPRYGLRPKGKV